MLALPGPPHQPYEAYETLIHLPRHSCYWSCRVLGNCGKLALLAWPGRDRGLFGKEPPATMEHERKRALANRLARPRQFLAHRLGQAHFHYPGGGEGASTQPDVLRAR